MARGFSTYRRMDSKQHVPAHSVPGCDLQDAQPPMDDSNCNLDASINQALQRRGGRPVKAFVLMALHDDGDVSTHTTIDMQQCTNRVFTSDAEAHLRLAHGTSMLGSNNATNANDLLTASTYGRQPTQSDHAHDAFCGLPRTHDHSASVSVTTSDATSGPYEAKNSQPSRRATITDNASGENPVTAYSQRMQSIRVDEASKIDQQIAKWFRALQQLPIKRIAKAWIKGICPKKQANFPYHKKKREREGQDYIPGDIPGWWPPTTECRFVEPDHIKRDERINLVVHILLLRPAPALLKSWNNDSVKPHQTHVTKGWTDFLMELAPPSMFDEMREPDDRTSHRQKLLSQIYELARLQERYERGEVDASDRFFFEGDDDDRLCQRKRYRQSCELSNDESGSESLSSSTPLAKRMKRSSETTTPAISPGGANHVEAEPDHFMPDRASRCSAEPQPSMTGTYSRSMSVMSHQTGWEQCHSDTDSKTSSILRYLQDQSHSAQRGQRLSSQPFAMHSPWMEQSSPASFCASVTSAAPSVVEGFSTEPSTSDFPGRQDFKFPATTLDQNQITIDPSCPRYIVTQLSQPQMDSMSGNVIYAPVNPANSPFPNIQTDQQPTYSQSVMAGPANIPQTPQMQFFTPLEASSGTSCSQQTIEACPTLRTAGPPQHAGFVADMDTYFTTEPEQAPVSFPYPEFRPGTDFQAPARIERGFTGHGSGVGGGAFT